MSKISLTVQQITDLGLWDQVCEYKGWNPWVRNEGQISDAEIVEFDSEFKAKNEKKLEIPYGHEFIRKNIVYSIIQILEFEYNYESYIKYLVSYRNLDNGEVKFELKNIDEIEWILELDKY